MQSISTILTRIEAHCAAHGIAESTFGFRVVNDGKFVSRLRSGGSMTLRTLERIEEVLADKPAKRAARGPSKGKKAAIDPAYAGA